VLEAITAARLDAVVGYTQRFRRKWLAAKEKVRTGALGDVTLVTSRAFMNRLVAIDNYKRTDDPTAISPMVISGTHALDIVMWCMEAKTPIECYARSIDKVLGPVYQGIDATAGMIMFSDGSVYHLNISWALRRHPSRHGARGLGAAKRRLCAGRAPAGGFHGQLSARRHGAG
jgi:predicted dehydrogenase